MNIFFGMRVVSSETCVSVTRAPKLEKLPSKRRRRWRLTYETVSEPVAYRAGDVILAHPTIIAKLKEASNAPA